MTRALKKDPETYCCYKMASSSYTKCVYHNCFNTSQDISMFRFPVHDPERIVLWIRNSGNIFLDSLTNEELRCRYICAAHFLPSYIHKGNIRSRLIGPAVPIHFQCVAPPAGTTSTQKTVPSDMETTNITSSPEILKVITPKKFYSRRTRTPTIERRILSSTPSPQDSIFNELSTITTPTQRMSRKCLFEGPKRRLSRKCIFEQHIDDSPKTKRLKFEASSLLRKNKAQLAKITRLRKSKSQHKTPSENFRSNTSKTLALMQLRKPNDKKPWTKEEKDFCLCLFYKSPATYYFMRRQGIVLASPSTIRTWLAKSNCLPGLCPDIFRKIQKRFENSTIKEKSCVVAFDEMSIMSNLEYSKKYDLIEGFEDLGGNHRTNKIAKHALVFVIRGLYKKWKLPVAYYLSSSNVKAEHLQLLLKAIINKLFDHGMLPKAVVCDQATTNQKVYKSLGINSENPFFFCNGRKIFALYDVPHLIKNIRNNFLNNNFIYKNEEYSFQDVIKTYELDQNSMKSRSLTKITEKHLKPNSFQKMRVSLATQIFSNSVAAAITTAKGTGQLQSKTAMATANFVKLVNNMFDALNSRQKYDKNPYRHALSKESTFVRSAIINGKNLFKNLQKIAIKVKAGQCERFLSRPPCFDGVVQSCEAVLQLFGEESSEPSISFLITTKLNQDIIENLFARFRQKGGANRNPTAKMLRTIFRSNLINSLIKLPDSKNCQDEDDEYLQIETEPHNTTETEQQNLLLNSSDDNSLSLECNITNATTSSGEARYTDDDNLTSADFTSKITLEQCSVTYFAGYLAHTCLRKYKCEKCLVNLIKDNIDIEDERQLLILNKAYNFNKGIKLKMPSDKLSRFINVALDEFNKHFENIVHGKDIKLKMSKSIVDFLKCYDKDLLNISCKEHLLFIINKMIIVKLHYYCKSKKNKTSEPAIFNPKLRILKNK